MHAPGAARTSSCAAAASGRSAAAYGAQRIRFGNAVEFWDVARDVHVLRCAFDQVYDSCMTHQGSAPVPAVHVRFVGNLCMRYGMAAYECRDAVPIDARFDENTCIGAGEGFSAAGVAWPRASEIWPQPMGHHVFLWRMRGAVDGGDLRIERNAFADAPHGAAIYSIADAGAESQVRMRDNAYGATNDALFIRFGGRDFATFDAYRRETGQDEGSRYENIDAAALVDAWCERQGHGE